MRWNLDHLRFFLALAQHKRLTRAASEVGASHSTVLRRIRALEGDLQVRLFEKTPDGFQLTSNGAKLLEAVETVDGTMHAISRQLSGADSRVAGHVVISTTDTLGYRVLPRTLARLKLAHPGLRIDLRVDNAMADIAAMQADIAVRASRSPPPGVIGRRVGIVQFRACASREYLELQPTEAFPTNVAGHRFIGYGDSLAQAPFSRWLADRLPHDADVAVASGVMAGFELCRAGLGITVLPSYLVDDDAQLVSLPVPSPLPTNELWLLSHEDLRGVARISTTKAFLREELARRFGSS